MGGVTTPQFVVALTVGTMIGVFIRSVGERTERLCIEACRSCLPAEQVHLLRDFTPSYRVYEEMFRRAATAQYDWFLGLDADVVLRSDWLGLAKQYYAQVSKGDWLVFSLAVQDPFLGVIDRGNHFYNGRHALAALEVLTTKTRSSLKPESSICHFLPYPDPHFMESIIGYHGYEQFYRDIYKRFWLQAQRKPTLEKQFPFLYTKDEMHDTREREIARLGWQTGRSSMGVVSRWRQLFFTGSRRGTATQTTELLQSEKGPLRLSLEEFYNLVRV